MVLEIKTDSLLFKPTRRADKELLGRLRFKDLAVRDLFEKEPKTRRLNEYHELPTHASEALAFRVQPATEDDLMKISPGHPRRTTVLQYAPKVWRDMDKEEAKRRVLHGESLLVLGIAGTGKSTFCKECVEELRSLGRVVEVVAKCHVAAARISGVTADYFARRRILHGSMGATTTIWIDEISQIDVQLWNAFNKVPNVQWLLSGDFNQFPALWNTFRGATVHDEALERSSFLRDLCGCNRLTLREGHRSCAELFNFYSSLIVGGQRFTQALPEALNAARALCSWTGPARNNLVISHRRRVALNRALNRTFLPVDVQPVFVRAKPAKGQLCAAQSMLLWNGIQLLGCCASSARRGVKNNVLYVLEDLTEDTARLRAQEGETTPIDLSLEQVAAWTRLSFSRTYASCQGWQAEESLRLHDTTNKNFTMRHLFVATSRARDFEHLAIS